ncbi:MAG: hypothetical protein J5855_03560 [Mailhella sp.]|nr:hypothetical protein [Mailhella sp.]
MEFAAASYCMKIVEKMVKQDDFAQYFSKPFSQVCNVGINCEGISYLGFNGIEVAVFYRWRLKKRLHDAMPVFNRWV